jgi:ABC-2 type transport system ATP-binding protein
VFRKTETCETKNHLLCGWYSKCSLMEDPSLLILDEPMNGLDNQGVEDIRNILLKFKGQGKTILLASHNREDIEILCDTVTEMDRGKVCSG